AIERPSAAGARRRQQVAGAETQRRELAGREIAAAVREVAGDVAQDVSELQRLAEAHALLAHLAQRPVAEAGPMRDVEHRPERANASGHEIDVVVELLERLDGRQFRGVLTR